MAYRIGSQRAAPVMQRLNGMFWPNPYSWPNPYPWPKPLIYCQTRSAATMTKTVYYKCYTCGNYTNSQTHICTHCSRKKDDDITSNSDKNDFENIALQVYLGLQRSEKPPEYNGILGIDSKKIKNDDD